MANMTRYDPFGLTNFDPFADVDDMFRDFFRGSLMSRPTAAPQMMPFKIDVDEHENEYAICADMPGVKKEDIKISIDGNQVTIDAEVKREATGEGETGAQEAGAANTSAGTGTEGGADTGGGAEAGKTGAGGKPGRNLRTERYYGRIYRSFVLPHEVDQEGAKARLENGVLKLTLPKRQAAGTKQISID